MKSQTFNKNSPAFLFIIILFNWKEMNTKCRMYKLKRSFGGLNNSFADPLHTGTNAFFRS